MVMKVFVKHSKLEEGVVMRAKVGFEEVEGRECIIFLKFLTKSIRQI
jgi:hypothetical protein